MTGCHGNAIGAKLVREFQEQVGPNRTQEAHGPTRRTPGTK
jgi:hypothetical protein